eukprot:1155183-Pelagomonas_calceolata.AAC.3
MRYDQEALQHAAEVKRPETFLRLHAAMIDLKLKQVYSTRPRTALWDLLQLICMPASMLAVRKKVYGNNGHVLVHGCNQTPCAT